jgi:hypothetical protein
VGAGREGREHPGRVSRWQVQRSVAHGRRRCDCLPERSCIRLRYAGRRSYLLFPDGLLQWRANRPSQHLRSESRRCRCVVYAPALAGSTEQELPRGRSRKLFPR